MSRRHGVAKLIDVSPRSKDPLSRRLDDIDGHNGILIALKDNGFKRAR